MKYAIIRFYRGDKPSEVIRKNLTLLEAQKHCNDPKTSTPDYFADFCYEFGYDEDSRKAERLYHKLEKFSKRLRTFFTEEEQAELQEIQ